MLSMGWGRGTSWPPCNCRSRLIQALAPPKRLPIHLFFASLLFSATKTAAITRMHHPAFMMAQHGMAASTVQYYRRSARLQKRSITSGEETHLPEKYNSLKVPELKDLLRDRGLAVSGVKSALIERLSSADTDSSTTSPSPTSNGATTKGASNLQPRPKRARKKSALETIPATRSLKATPPAQSAVGCLPRTREVHLQSTHEDSNDNLVVIGVDEAGRGPLAGPVVAAAAIVPTNISGIIDSKKITKEEERERLYEELIASPDIRYAVAVVSSQRIDEINILQATLEGMRMAVEGVMNIDHKKKDKKGMSQNVASAERNDISYVITGGAIRDKAGGANNKPANNSFYALIDGNRVPNEMPCPCESLVKGDGREYSIGAASILAKVTRDRLMHEYNEKYPEFSLSQHKGYPTAAHMSAVRKFGASPIHRRTFAPLKHMEFDADGKVIG